VQTLDELLHVLASPYVDLPIIPSKFFHQIVAQLFSGEDALLNDKYGPYPYPLGTPLIDAHIQEFWN
jgi:hypothetical protein